MGWGRLLKFKMCLLIPLLFNNRSIVHFCGWWKWGGGHLLVIFCGRHKSVTSKTIIISKKANVWNGKTSNIPETLILIIRHTIT